MNTNLMFSSKTDDWDTPQNFFDSLNLEFSFNLDPCANTENHKCDRFFTEADDGLKQDWGGSTVFCNPPYGRNMTGKWIQKAYEESQKPNTVCVCLVPSRTDTRWFHEYVLGKSEIRFVKGRLKFGAGINPAPFPSMVVIYRSPDSDTDMETKADTEGADR